MKIPESAEIAPEKLTGYLLVPRSSDDKSKFLARASFIRDNPDELVCSLRRLANEAAATEDGRNEFGVFFRADGMLVGPKVGPLPSRRSGSNGIRTGRSIS